MQETRIRTAPLNRHLEGHLCWPTIFHSERWAQFGRSWQAMVGFVRVWNGRTVPSVW